jgi:hypothetical protein
MIVATQSGNRSQQPAPVPNQANAEVPQVVGRQLRQYRGVDRVVAKRLFVLLHAKAVEPGRDVHLASSPRSPPRRSTLPGLPVAREKSARIVAVHSYAV